MKLARSAGGDVGDRARYRRAKKIRNCGIIKGALFATLLSLFAVGAGGIAAAQVATSPGKRRLNSGDRVASTMTELLHATSNGKCANWLVDCVEGTNVMETGGTTTVTAGEYKCSDGGTCHDKYTMLALNKLPGTIACENDSVESCVINGENGRRGLSVHGTDSEKLTIRAIKFWQGTADNVPEIGGVFENGGGLFVDDGANVVIILCTFDSCAATDIGRGGGGIFVRGGGTVVNIYATIFKNNEASAGKGKDVRRVNGAVNIYNICPSPYDANTPAKGEKKKRAL